MSEEKSPVSNKAFKQARLPFKVLDIKSPLLNNIPKKRKLSSEDSSNEAKVAKKDTNAKNSVQSANNDVAISSHDSKGAENLKPPIQNSNPEPDVFSKKEHLDVAGTDDADYDIKPSQNRNSQSECSERLAEEYDKKDENDSTVNDTSGDLDELMLSDEDASPRHGSLDVSVCSQLQTSTIEEQSEASELEKSLCVSGLSTAPGSDNECSTPANKTESGLKKPARGRKSVEKLKHKEEKIRLRQLREKELQEARAAKRQEKEREKDRKEVERNLAKQKKKQELEEKIKQKEQKKIEALAKKQAENDEKMKVLEEKKAKKLEAIQAKLDEKKRKDEEKQRKKEEKQKEEDEKQRKLEEKKKADNEVSAKSKAVFASFFIKGSPVPQPASVEESPGLFKPFEVMKNMVLASITPNDVITQFDKKYLDNCFQSQNSGRLYLEELKHGKRTPYKRKKTPVAKADDCDDIIIIENTKSAALRAKLYQFCENIRPPYYGTWTKTSKTVTGRKPFVLDTVAFDYEVDSEEEWDEGGPGESLSGTEDEKESEDDYEVDNEFFVPHGYLSADEEEEDEMAVDSAEHQARLKMRERLFQEERKQKFSELKPRVIGCVWTSADGSSFSNHQMELAKVLFPYKAVLLCEIPISLVPAHKGFSPKGENSEDRKGDSSERRNKRIPEEAMPHLIRLVHANTNSRQIIQKEFMQYWTEFRHNTGIIAKEGGEDNEKASTPNSGTPEKEGEDKDKSPSSPSRTVVYNTGFSKRQLELTLNKIGTYGRCPDPNYPRFVWWINENIRNKYECTDLPVPNKWCYVSRSKTSSPGSRGRKKAVKLVGDVPEKNAEIDTETPVKSGVPEDANSILKFTCKMSPAERFEASLQSKVSKKNETESSTSTSATNRVGPLLKYTRPLTLANSNNLPVSSSPKSENETPVTPKLHNSLEVKDPESQKATCSILKFARKITPVRLDSSVKTASENQATSTLSNESKLKSAGTVEVITLSEDSNK